MEKALLQTLDEIEAEMQRLGYWHPSPPDLQAEIDGGTLRSYLDAPSFELWLQAVFLPHAREAVTTHNLPADSQVGRMALRQYDYHASVPEARDLVRRLHEFDDLVRQCRR